MTIPEHTYLKYVTDEKVTFAKDLQTLFGKSGL